jgi:hypothetical protein
LVPVCCPDWFCCWPLCPFCPDGFLPLCPCPCAPDGFLVKTETWPPRFPCLAPEAQAGLANTTVTVFARVPEAVDSNEAVPLTGNTETGGDAVRDNLLSCPAVALILNTAVTVQAYKPKKVPLRLASVCAAARASAVSTSAFSSVMSPGGATFCVAHPTAEKQQPINIPVLKTEHTMITPKNIAIQTQVARAVCCAAATSS